MSDWPPTEQLKQMSREDVGMLILRRLDSTPPNNRHLRNFTFTVLNEVTPRPTGQASVTTQQQILGANPEASGRIASAWQWLINQGYIARDMTQSSAAPAATAIRTINAEDIRSVLADVGNTSPGEPHDIGRVHDHRMAVIA